MKLMSSIRLITGLPLLLRFEKSITGQRIDAFGQNEDCRSLLFRFLAKIEAKATNQFSPAAAIAKKFVVSPSGGNPAKASYYKLLKVAFRSAKEALP